MVDIRLDEKTVDELKRVAYTDEKEFLHKIRDEMKLPHYILHFKNNEQSGFEGEVNVRKGYDFVINSSSADIVTFCFIPKGKKFLATVTEVKYNTNPWKIASKTVWEIVYDGKHWKKQNVRRTVNY